MLCDSGEVCLSLSACPTIEAGLCLCRSAIETQRGHSDKCSDQVFEGKKCHFFGQILSEFPTESDRISTESQTESQNFSNRILTEFQSNLQMSVAV